MPSGSAPRGLAVVTGATGGLGLEVALGLARAGLDVLLTGRSPERGAAALQRVQSAGQARFALLDVADLSSVERFAATLDQPVAVLVNNAGVMALPRRQTTVDGFEQQLGTNFLGHFALTARLRPLLAGARVVNVSSVAHRRGRIHFDDLQSGHRYAPWAAYAQSKLAMLMFALELHRRSAANGWNIASIPAHPGWAASALVRKGLGSPLLQAGFNLIAQSTEAGALPLLHAALSPAATPGAYYGPCCWAETRGRPAPARIYPQALNEADCSRLWQAAATLTGTG